MGTILTVDTIRKEFGGLVAVNDVSFSVEEGNIFSIIGPNGAGKTTVFNLITGAYPLTSGKVIFNGEDITGKKIYEIAARGVSRTFQNLKLIGNQNLIDNVMLGQHTKFSTNFVHSILRTKKEREEEQRALEFCMSVLEFVGLDKKWNYLASSLPYGEQRLLEIARALCTDPKVIFLDEPAAGMNAVESARLVELIRKIQARGITPIVIEHDMKVIMTISDDIIVLDHGTLICHGDPEAVKNDPRVIEAYLGKEME
jgi:ATPase